MRRIHFLPLVLLGIIAMIPSKTSAQNFFKEHVSFENMTETMNEIRTYYDTTFIPTEVVDVNDAMQTIQLALTALLNTQTVSPSCSTGPFSLIETIPSSTNATTLRVQWGQNTGSINEYFGGYIDLTDLSAGLITQNAPEIYLPLPGFIDKKFYVFNGRCSNYQASYVIIIIEKDLDLNQEDDGGIVVIPPDSTQTSDPQERLTQAVSNTELSVFPNPVDESFANLEFSIKEGQKVSVELLEGSTGRLIQSIISNQFYRKGTHRSIIHLEGLPSGVYYLTLQTETERVVKKMIKI